MAMRHLIEERGIDLIQMQLDVYTKAMAAFDSHRGDTDKSDAGPAYLSVCNQAIGTLAKYTFPTMTAIKFEDLNNQVNDKVIDAVAVRDKILNDPFAKNAVNASKTESIGVTLLPKPDEQKND
jgi:hypothetical protein